MSVRRASPITTTAPTVAGRALLSAALSVALLWLVVDAGVVHAAAAPPVFDPPADATIPEEVAYGSTLTASDADGDPLSFSLVSGPAGLTVAADGTLAWTPAEDQGPASYPVTVSVSDGDLAAQTTFSLTVTEVNRPPVLETIADVTADVGVSLVVGAVASDPDLPVTALTFSLPTAPPGATIDPSSGVVTWTPADGDIGAAIFTVRVTDTGDPAMSAEASFSVDVAAPPAPPTTTPPAPTRLVVSASGRLDGDGSRVKLSVVARSGPRGPSGWLVLSERPDRGSRGVCLTIVGRKLSGVEATGTDFPTTMVVEGRATMRAVDCHHRRPHARTMKVTFVLTLVDQARGWGKDQAGIVVRGLDGSELLRLEPSRLRGRVIVRRGT